MIARLIISLNQDQRMAEIKKYLLEKEISNPHPDLLFLDSSQKLGIEQARKIKQYFSTKPYSSSGKAVVLEDASKLTDEAQNSLLKTLEELTTDSLFILGANSDVNFLPTILSRCQIVRLDNNSTEIQAVIPGVEIGKLIQMDTAGKFEYIEKLKDRKQFLIDLIVYFRKEMIKNPHDERIIGYVKKLTQAEEQAASNVNIRAILEYLMLVMPPNK